jgi:hypothetical protein
MDARRCRTADELRGTGYAQDGVGRWRAVLAPDQRAALAGTAA